MPVDGGDTIGDFMKLDERAQHGNSTTPSSQNEGVDYTWSTTENIDF